MAIRKILVVEDDAISQKLLDHRLRSRGYEVFLAANGADVVPLARKHAPDLVLMDIVLPRKNGGEVIRDMKADPTLRSIPVVFMSSIVTDDENPATVRVGNEDYPAVPKPIDFDRLWDVINQVEAGMPSEATK